MVELYAIKLNKKLENTDFAKMMNYISEDKRERILKFRKIEDAQRALIGDVLIRYLICKRKKFKNNQIVFDKNKFGKPFLRGSSDLHFNISHSEEWVVCAIAATLVGVDVELIHTVDLDIAKRFFSRDEYKALMELKVRERLGFFFEIWTLKESYIKAIGTGLSTPLDSFSMRISDKEIQIITENEFKNCFFKQYEIDDNYKLAVCSDENDFSNKIINLDINEFVAEVIQSEFLR